MTGTQKQRIEYLRGKGESYSVIAAALSISENTIKSYCRRQNIGARHHRHHMAELPVHAEDICKNCKKPLEHTPGAKKRCFCSDKCRMAWWNSHPEAVTRKAIYQFKCEVCGVHFESYGNAHRKYCSRACFGAARRASE